MGHPVYPFRAVLKALRKDAGLTVLAAAEATHYGNYERWESGHTRVGGQHLDRIADTFAVTDDLWLLVYAWIVDRLTPSPSEAAVSIPLTQVRRHLRDAPRTTVDLHEHKALVVQPSRHVEVALFGLAARYADGGLLVLTPAERSPLPESTEEPTLRQLYGDVAADTCTVVGRTLVGRGLDDRLLRRVDVGNIGPALASPEVYRALADHLEGIDSAEHDPLATFAAGTAADSRRFAELLDNLRPQLRALIEAARRRPASNEEVERLAADVCAGKLRRLVSLTMRAGLRGRLPSVDPTVTAELREMLDRLRHDGRAAIEQQVVVELREAEVDEVFGALDVLRRRRSA